MSLWIFAGLLFVFGFSLSIIGIARTMSDLTPRQRERDKQLGVHFGDMQKVVSSIIPNLKENNGQIYSPNSSLDNSLKGLPPEFEAHFPREDNAWNIYCVNIKIHDEKYKEILQRIQDSFASLGLQWIDNMSQPKSPGISRMIYEPLFVWWNCRYNHSPHIIYDFEKVSSKLYSQGQEYTDINHLFVPGYSPNYIAYFDNEK
jgi:hypothetical protein